jgi:hypothetical protein
MLEIARKVTTALLAETLDDFQHFMPLISES